MADSTASEPEETRNTTSRSPRRQGGDQIGCLDSGPGWWPTRRACRPRSSSALRRPRRYPHGRGRSGRRTTRPGPSMKEFPSWSQMRMPSPRTQIGAAPLRHIAPGVKCKAVCARALVVTVVVISTFSSSKAWRPGAGSVPGAGPAAEGRRAGRARPTPQGRPSLPPRWLFRDRSLPRRRP